MAGLACIAYVFEHATGRTRLFPLEIVYRKRFLTFNTRLRMPLKSLLELFLAYFQFKVSLQFLHTSLVVLYAGKFLLERGELVVDLRNSTLLNFCWLQLPTSE